MILINSNKETLSFDIKGESWNDIEEIRNILIDIPCIDKNYGNLSCDFSEVQELQAWLDFFAIEYSLSEEAQIDCASFLVFDRETEFFRGETFDTSILAETAVPYNYQLEAINWQIKRSRIYNSFDAGLAKCHAGDQELFVYVNFSELIRFQHHLLSRYVKNILRRLWSAYFRF